MLKDAILEKIQQHSIEPSSIADIAGVPTSRIIDFLDEKNSLFFEAVLKIVKQFFPLQEHEYMVTFALQETGENARFSLEYTNMNQLRAISEILISKLRSSDELLDQEWAKVYELEMMRYKKTLAYEDLLHRINLFQTSTIETSILLAFFKVYILYDLNRFEEMDKQINIINSMLKDVDNQFLQDSFYIRLGLIMNQVCLNRNDLELARYYCRLIIDRHVSTYLKSSAYMNLGRTYFFDDYDKAKNYLENAIKGFELSESPHYARIAENNLSFLNSYWKIEREFELDFITFQEKSYFAFYLIQKGERREAQEVLNLLFEDVTTNWQKALYDYYLGVLKQDRGYLLQSAESFQTLGDYFHLNLPIRYLRQLGVSEEELAQFNIKTNNGGV